jgi:prolyl 4-hydroxylase
MQYIKYFIILFFIITIITILFINKNTQHFIITNDYIIEEIPNFLTKEECDQIIRMSANKLSDSKVYKETDVSDHTVRISNQCWLKNTDDDLIKNISHRIAIKTNTDINLQEDAQVVKYDQNGFYKPHYDACDRRVCDYCDRMNTDMGPRYITFIIYLNDSFDGGETYFKNIDTKIIPEIGKGLIFYNINMEGDILEKSLHGGLKVNNGEKWIINKWIHLGK